LYPDFTINTLTVHRFLITAATVGAKGLSDSFWNNTTYARVGGVRVQELKTLELEFLNRVDWKIVPQPEVLVAYYKGLIKRCPDYILEEDPESSDAPGTATDNDISGEPPNGDDSTEISEDDDDDDAEENPETSSRAQSDVGSSDCVGVFTKLSLIYQPPLPPPTAKANMLPPEVPSPDPTASIPNDEVEPWSGEEDSGDPMPGESGNPGEKPWVSDLPKEEGEKSPTNLVTRLLEQKFCPT
ncbi:Nuc-1 negative regulatory protein preg like, partial [Zalerion maritima]